MFRSLPKESTIVYEKTKYQNAPGKAILTVSLGYVARIRKQIIPAGNRSHSEYGCATPRHQHKTPNSHTQLKSTARSQPFEKLFKNYFNPIFSQIFKFSFFNAIILFFSFLLPNYSSAPDFPKFSLLSLKTFQ